jgi:hypothetical protein
MRILISITILLICMASCNQEKEIAGHWRPADAFESGHETSAAPPRFRDLMLNSDSTFVIAGLDQQLKQTEGWHNGDTQKGKWNFSNGILSLLIEDVSRPVKFKEWKMSL